MSTKILWIIFLLVSRLLQFVPITFEKPTINRASGGDKLINRERRNVKFGALNRTWTSQFSRQSGVINTAAHGVVGKQATTRGRISIPRTLPRVVEIQSRKLLLPSRRLLIRFPCSLCRSWQSPRLSPDDWFEIRGRWPDRDKGTWYRAGTAPRKPCSVDVATEPPFCKLSCSPRRNVRFPFLRETRA